MKSFERIFLHLINAWMFVFAGFAIGFLMTYPQKEAGVPWLSIVGALAGLAVWWASRARLLELLLHNTIYQLGIDCVYMVGLFGFFMGVPVFNILPGIGLAYIHGLNARQKGLPAEAFTGQLRQVNGITLAILCVFLAASAAIALLDPYTGGNLQGMFGLTNQVTLGQIALIIAVGGLGLMAAQWLLERWAGKWAYGLKA